MAQLNNQKSSSKTVTKISTTPSKLNAATNSNYVQYRVVSVSASKVYPSAKGVRITKRVISN